MLARKLDILTSNYGEVVVVSGCAKGADSLGEKWANERGHKVVQFPADWNRHGRSAGTIRNLQMADYVQQFDHCAVAAFWDGLSAGTRRMIGTAKTRGIPLRTIMFNPTTR